MATAILGETFTFHTKFLDGSNVPFIPLDPTVEAFYFDVTGTRVTLLAAGTPMLPVPLDTGRFSFVYSVPSSLDPGLTIYAFMRGTDPSTGLEAVVEIDVELLTPAGVSPSPSPGTGLIARFVK